MVTVYNVRNSSSYCRNTQTPQWTHYSTWPLKWSVNKIVWVHYTKGKGSPYSITERVTELIPVLGSQPAGDVSHKPGGISCHYFPPGLQLTLAALKRAATSFNAW